ncbi:MAG: RES domain-containing protein [Burkholderiales bacterium]|nr:RES domain-containing protein [Burkholderiales bacterium]
MALRRKQPVSARSNAAPSSQPSAKPWQAWRIADGRFDPFRAVGASLVGGRWILPGPGVIYANRSYAGAMPECLAHAGIGRVPRTNVALGSAIAPTVAVELQDKKSLPAGWDHADLRVARAFGDAWIRERRSAVLIVRERLAVPS